MGIIGAVKKDLRRTTKGSLFIAFLRNIISTSGFKAILYYRIANLLYKKGFNVLSIFFEWLIKIRYASDISRCANIGGGLMLPHPYAIAIGAKVSIAENCFIGQSVTLGGNFNKNENGRSQPSIGFNCCVCAGSVIIGPVIIGDNVIVGANSVVTKSFPNDLIIGGNPARIIKNGSLDHKLF